MPQIACNLPQATWLAVGSYAVRYSWCSAENSYLREAVPDAASKSTDGAVEFGMHITIESGFGATQPPGPAAPQPKKTWLVRPAPSAEVVPVKATPVAACMPRSFGFGVVAVPPVEAVAVVVRAYPAFCCAASLGMTPRIRSAAF